MVRLFRLLIVLGSLACFSNASAAAGDWPQILGPHRNGSTDDESIVDGWGKEGPATVWQQDVGSGFSGVAVAQGIVILFHRVDDHERVEAMHAGTGDPIWKADFPAPYIPSFTRDNGPRAVPLIHKNRVYVYGAKGNLHCLDLKKGRKIWSRDTFEDYSSKRRFKGEPPEGYFGIGTTPIIEGDKIIVNIGGDTKNAGIVAFDVASGETVWKATRERASYSSPVAETVNGQRHLIFVTRLNIVSLNPKNGKVRFRLPYGAPGPKVSAATPLVLDGHLFVTASYHFGAMFAEIKPTKADVLWTSDNIMSSQYTTCLESQGNLFGIHGRQDMGATALRCFNPRTQKIRWEESEFGYATLIKADDKLLALKTNGELVLADLNVSRYNERARASLFGARATARALPALANGLFYARDTNTLKCIDLRKQK